MMDEKTCAPSSSFILIHYFSSLVPTYLTQTTLCLQAFFLKQNGIYGTLTHILYCELLTSKGD